MGSEFMVRVQDVCFSVKFAGFECSVHYLRVRVWVWDALCGLRVAGLGFRVWDFGFGGSGRRVKLARSERFVLSGTVNPSFRAFFMPQVYGPTS